MRLIFIVLFCVGLPAIAPILSIAHPPVGIVCDSEGNIFYSDLVHVWKISSDGKKSIAVRNVHTHELYLDEQDNLYGQGSMYSGETTNKFYHYLWRLSRSGKLDTVKGVTEGFFIEDYSFVRNSSGEMFWIKHFANRTSMMKTVRSAYTKTLVQGDFKNVQWMHAIGNSVYYVQNGSIYHVAGNGTITKIATSKDDSQSQQNALFGIWSDQKKRIYVANFSKAVVQQVGIKGALREVYHCPPGWKVTGGVFDRRGVLWVLETNAKNEVRVNRTSFRA